MGKKHFLLSIAIIGILTIAFVGLPYGKFIESTFAQYFTGAGPGAGSVSSGGFTASVSPAADFGCLLSISGIDGSFSTNSGLGSGLGIFTLVKNVQASESADFQVFQFNGPNNVPVFEIFFNKVTGQCSIKALA
jgi:hypothetical protein